jgi:hypothetical protein
MGADAGRAAGSLFRRRLLGLSMNRYISHETRKQDTKATT